MDCLLSSSDVVPVTRDVVALLQLTITQIYRLKYEGPLSCTVCNLSTQLKAVCVQILLPANTNSAAL